MNNSESFLNNTVYGIMADMGNRVPFDYKWYKPILNKHGLAYSDIQTHIKDMSLNADLKQNILNYIKLV